MSPPGEVVRHSPPGAARARRELLTAVLLTATGAGLTLLAAGRPWAQAVVEEGPLRLRVDPSGRALAGAVPALALAGLAGAVAVLATRRIGRLVTGALVFLAGAGVVVITVLTVADLAAAVRPAAGRAVGQQEAAPAQVRATAWPWPAAVGGALMAGAGVLTLTRGRGWPGMSRRYEARPAAARPAPEGAPDGAMWDALDRGDDPTA